jgi:tetratricopeptide (TPR) repeat protein
MTIEHDHSFSHSHPSSKPSDEQIPTSGEQDNNPLSTVAAAAGGGIAGATVGRLIGGQAGTTIGAVIGGMAAAAIGHTLSHNLMNGDRNAVVEADAGSKEISGDRDQAEVPELEQTSPKLRRAKTHYQLGVVLGRQKHISAAIEEFETVLRLAPDSAETHYNLGVALAKQGNILQGMAYLRQAQDLCLRQGKFEGAKLIEQTLWQLATEA